MIYFVSSLIALILAIIETSFFPHFKLFGASPFLVLAFICALSLKNKGTFHLVVAFLLGLYFDHISNGFPYTFTAIFSLTVIITRIFFYRNTSYDVKPAFLSALGISTIAVYLLQIGTLAKVNFLDWQNYLLMVVTGLTLTLLAGYIMFILLTPYFDWLARVSEEKFRG